MCRCAYAFRGRRLRRTSGACPHRLPEDDRSFAVEMTAYIGTDDRDETDAFDFTVCTPDRLAIWEKEMEGSSGPSVVAPEVFL